MNSVILATALLLVATETLDRVAQPRPPGWRFRSLMALPFRLAVAAAVFGAFLLLTGRTVTAATVTVLILFTASAGSNVKFRLLGEPLCFTDLALVREMVRHPGFYVGAIPASRRVLLALVVLAAGAALVFGSALDGQLRLVGLGLLLLPPWAALQLLRLPPWCDVMRDPDLAGDLARHGLLATLLVYPARLRGEAPLQPVAERPGSAACAPPLVVVVQCESFADPAQLAPAVVAETLPGLAAARARAVRHGRLAVSGFGAYTMRTEYGVLFGREEAELGFRRFDPFLSAGDAECGNALPHRLRRRFPGCRAVFVHPHPLDFYGRSRLMRRAGFDRLMGEDAFADAPTVGPHVSDAALGDALLRLIDAPAADRPDLLYAVTIENHGPWASGRLDAAADGVQAWLHHLRHGDALLSRLVERLERSDRPAVLCFFGDHRPSIPGAVTPTAERDTPFAILRFRSGKTSLSLPERLTPAALHHAILEAADAAAAGDPDGPRSPDRAS